MGSLTVLHLASNLITAKPRNIIRGNLISSNHKPDTKQRYISNKSTSTNWLSNNFKKMHDNLPVYASGEIVRGFGRGSKELGIPTANFPLEVVKSLPEFLHTGVYYGWANVDNGDVHKMVLSVGWNPFYNNKEKSVETHMLHNFNCDLYGKTLKICIAGYLRNEQNFDSLDALIAVIKSDIEKSKTLLDTEENKNLKTSPFFSEEIKKC